MPSSLFYSNAQLVIAPSDIQKFFYFKTRNGKVHYYINPDSVEEIVMEKNKLEITISSFRRKLFIENEVLLPFASFFSEKGL